MDDLISRAAAIEAVEKAKTARTADGEIYVAKINAEMNIQLLPPAHPKRKKGKWIDDDGQEVKYGLCATCSTCGEWSEYLTDFCPNCGADMRGEAE